MAVKRVENIEAPLQPANTCTSLESSIILIGCRSRVIGHCSPFWGDVLYTPLDESPAVLETTGAVQGV